MCASLLLCDKIMIVHVFEYFVNGRGTHVRNVSFCAGFQSSHYLSLYIWNKIQKTKYKFIFNGFLPKKNEWYEIIILLEYFLPSPTMWYGFVRVSFIAVRNNHEKPLAFSRYSTDVYAKSEKQNYTFLKDSLGIRYAWYVILVYIIELRKNI